MFRLRNRRMGSTSNGSVGVYIKATGTQVLVQDKLHYFKTKFVCCAHGFHSNPTRLYSDPSPRYEVGATTQ